MKKGILTCIVMLIALTTTGCMVSFGEDFGDDVHVGESGSMEQFQEQQALMEEQEKEQAALQKEYEKKALYAQYPPSIEDWQLERLEGSVTLSSTIDASKKYTVTFDSEYLPYIGELDESWGKEGYLYGDNSMGYDDVITVYCVDPQEYESYWKTALERDYWPIATELRKDALMYVYEGNFQGDTYWNIFFKMESEEGIEGVMFTNVTEKYFREQGMAETFDILRMFGELTIHE